MQIQVHSRRDFVKRAALLPLCTAGILGGLSASAGEPIKRAGGAALKVSLNAYCFNKLLNDYTRDHSQGISLMALL